MDADGPARRGGAHRPEAAVDHRPRDRRAGGARADGRGGAAAHVEGAQERVRRGGPASAPTTSCRTASSRARRSPGCCARSPGWPRSAGLRVANVFHAGDGNLHPLVLYDARARRAGGARPRSWAATSCASACGYGGSITGEHGVGAEKAAYMAEMFTEADLDTMGWVRCAFDPETRFNPGKVFPTPRLCGDCPGPYRPHPAELAGLAERMSDRRRAPASRAGRPGAVAEPGHARRGGRGPAPRGRRRRPSRLRRAAARSSWLGARRRRGSTRCSAPTRASTASSSTRPPDQIVTVEAGVTLAALQVARAAPASGSRSIRRSPARATLGGLVAANAFGPRRTRYGSVRDLIIGVSLVRADGAVARGGGKVVKNVAGFDLPRLMVGSLGTLGLIATVDLPAAPAARGAATVLLRRLDAEGVRGRVLGRSGDAQLEPARGGGARATGERPFDARPCASRGSGRASRAAGGAARRARAREESARPASALAAARRTRRSGRGTTAPRAPATCG